MIGGLLGGSAVLLLPVLLASSPGWLASARGLAVALYLGLAARPALGCAPPG